MWGAVRDDELLHKTKIATEPFGLDLIEATEAQHMVWVLQQ
jgi:hypothetical protein